MTKFQWEDFIIQACLTTTNALNVILNSLYKILINQR